MEISDIFINGLRNINNRTFSFSPSKNLIFGKNGAGKTSILEAIFLLGFGKSFLNVKLRDTLNYSLNEYVISANISSQQFGINKINAHYKNEKLHLEVNEKKRNLMDIKKYFFPLFFSSSDYTQYIVSASLLRKLIDRFIFGLYPEYYLHLLNYNRALKSKNLILKQSNKHSEIYSWNRVLSEAAVEIIRKRQHFIYDINVILEKLKFHLEIQNRVSIQTPQVSVDSLIVQYEKVIDFEIQFKKTLKGPHLDKYSLLKNKKNLKYYSSGEKKLNLLFIYIAYIELFYKINGEYPIVLTDDFDTAIDSGNIKILIDSFPSLQLISTSVNDNENFENRIQLSVE